LRDHLFRLKPVLSVTNYDCTGYDFSILKEHEISLVNQMTSWKEGTSFFTCSHGKQHFLENMFYSTPDHNIVDLFNFNNTWHGNPDQIWPLGDFQQCECGFWYREMNFQPCAIKGIKNYRGETIDTLDFTTYLLKESYEFFQIVQQKDGKTFQLHSSKTMHPWDYRFVYNWICKKYGKEVEIQQVGDLYSVGSRLKNPIFWSEVSDHHFGELNTGFKKL
jgi:hypothetical protein